MGCGESKDLDTSRFSVILDPEEEDLHLKSWQDASTRQRVLCDRDDDLNDQNADLDAKKALAFKFAIMRDDIQYEVPGACDSDVKEICSSAETVEGADVADADELKAKRDRLESEQEQEKVRKLLEIDPNCWQSLAEQGYFQKAEDLLMNAVDAELKVMGRTARYAHCLHGLGSLYDQRSNLDVTGQQQQFSLTSADYALRALEVWEELLRADPANRSLDEHRASSLLLRGRSLCNYAIDGDGCRGGGPSEEEAFGMAEAELGRALEIREGLGLDGLAEAVMAVGYLHYCRAGCIMRAGRYGPDGAELGPVYREALRHYTRSLNLYIDRDGQVPAVCVCVCARARGCLCMYV